MKDPGGDLKKIRYFMVTSMVNAESLRVMKRALSMDDPGRLRWPGMDFSMDSDGGKALLGKSGCFYSSSLLLAMGMRIANIL
jgi:hypothetical protein